MEYYADGPCVVPYKKDGQPSSYRPTFELWVCDDSFKVHPQGCEVGRFVVRGAACSLCKRKCGGG